jgi:ATP-dependent DNA ligase
MKVKVKMKLKMKSIELFHRKTSGAVKVWRCAVQGSSVTSEWGQLGGQFNKTVENVGAKGGMTAPQRAVALYEKKVDRRRRKGYVAHASRIVDTVEVGNSSIDFDKPLPRSFAPGKPIKTYDPTEIALWEAEGKLLIQRKRDGMRHYLVSDSNSHLKIYSSGKDDMTEHLMPLIVDIKLPPRTILDVELVVTEPGKLERDGFLIVSGIARSKPERARTQIALAQGMSAKVQLFAFDLLWEHGVPIYRRKYEERYRRLAQVVEYADQATEGRTLVRMPLVSISSTRLATLKQAIDMVKKYKWEGLVVWRRDQATVVRVNGSPCRVNCWKIKPVGEEDVIAYGYETGKGKNENVVGKFLIGVWDSSRKNYASSAKAMIKPMGKCGTGLTDKDRVDALKWKYPCVIQIEYDQKSEKGFRFPVFIRKRDDKKPSDCR